MKKTLVSALSAALVVGAASTTFAASNPFSDVPANSWAYNAVATLAKDGVVNGFPNGTYQGQKTMTRYEMAQIVAKAMAYENMTKADKAIVDKLAVEFGSELQNLGVKVANLEKKSDNVKLEGKVRYTYESKKVEDTKSHESSLKFKLDPTVFINDKVTGHAEMEYKLEPEKDSDNKGEVKVAKVYVDAKVGGVNATAGRFGAYVGNGLVYDHELTGLQLVGGSDKTTVTGYAGRYNEEAGKYNEKASAKDVTANVYGVQVNHKISDKVAVAAGYTMIRNAENVFSSKDYTNGIEYAVHAFNVEASKNTDVKSAMLGVKNAKTTVETAKQKAAEAVAKNASNAKALKIVAEQAENSLKEKKNIARDAVKTYEASAEGKKLVEGVKAAEAKATVDASKANIWYVGANAEVAKNVKLVTDFAKNQKADNFNKAMSFELDYRAADAKQAGSYGAFVAYRNLGKYAALHPTYDAIKANQKGIELGTSYVPAENIVATVKYFDGKNLALSGQKETKVKTLWTRVDFLF